MNIKHIVTVAVFAFVGVSAAFAQSPPTPATPPAQTSPPALDRVTANCAPTQTNAQGTITPNGAVTTGQGSETLGDKLAKSDGVLCPPSNIDPAIRTTAPNADGANTPVIKPPGSPGSDPSVRPK